MELSVQAKIEQLVDYIMKHCLWQFHSRAWDREKQNEGILSKTTQLLCDEPVEKETPADKCYWADAVLLAEGFQEKYAWLKSMSKEEIKEVMQGLKERMEFLTIRGSLNEELKDPRY
ncbi:hypothetical protein P22_3847 [Propionispora sp. 2/2-37]|nr:hypothetical protein P22_3847 [Propionispora sp. 2/2-37]